MIDSKEADGDSDNVTTKLVNTSSEEIAELKRINSELLKRIDLLQEEFKVPLAEKLKRNEFSYTLKAIINDLNHKYNTRPSSSNLNKDRERPVISNKVLVDDIRDTIYASSHIEFGDVLHIFHSEWFGIRAAAGSLPGRKIAIPAEESLTEQDFYTVKTKVLSIRPSRVIFHAMSPNMAALINLLAKEIDPRKLFFVHHGAPSQWFHEPDRNAVFIALDMLERGLLYKVHILRSGFDYDHRGIFKPILLNKAPKLDFLGRSEYLGFKGNTVFLPGWSGWRKNIYANAFAAASCSEVEVVLAYGNDIDLPDKIKHKLTFIDFVDRIQTIQIMASSRMTMNASLVDCHPMANVESQALGVPCIHGNLFLDALDDHEYCRFTKVEDVNSISEIKSKVVLCFSQSAEYLRELTTNYQQELDKISIERYGEFLEL